MSFVGVHSSPAPPVTADELSPSPRDSMPVCGLTTPMLVTPLARGPVAQDFTLPVGQVPGMVKSSDGVAAPKNGDRPAMIALPKVTSRLNSVPNLWSLVKRGPPRI